MNVNLIKIFSLSAVLALLLSLCGCGGGTEGTGGVTIQGRVLDISNLPLAGVEVKAADTNDIDVTDSAGTFAVVANTNITSATLAFKKAAAQASFTIDSIPADTESIEANFTVDFGSGSASAGNVQFKKRKPTNEDNSSGGNGPAATPTPDDHGSNSNDDKGEDNDGSSGGSGSSGGGDGGSNSGSSGGSGSNSGSGGGSSGGSGSGSNNNQEREVTGLITEVSNSAIVVDAVTFVPTNNTEYKDIEGKRTTIEGIFVGQTAKAKGKFINEVLTLEKLEIEDPEN